MSVKGILGDLVKFNTIKDKQNKEIMDYIESVLETKDFNVDYKSKCLIMSIKDEWSLGFVGHTDTVEAGNSWSTNPFNLEENKGMLYGLGSCDMKSGIAAILQAVLEIDWKKMSKGIKLYFTYDEEIGFSGIQEVVSYEKNFPEVLLIGEPTNHEIMVGSKGLLEYHISLKGIKAHSSTPEKGKNAIMSAISFVRDLQEFYETEIKTEENSDFAIPYTTMNLGKIQGGSAINSVPDFCEFWVDFRTIDEKVEKKIVSKIENLQKKYEAKVEELNRLSAFFQPSQISRKTSDFITEASFLPNQRIILGAGPVTAHEVDESISVKSLQQLVQQYKELIEKYCR